MRDMTEGGFGNPEKMLPKGFFFFFFQRRRRRCQQRGKEGILSLEKMLPVQSLCVWLVLAMNDARERDGHRRGQLDWDGDMSGM